ncbi:MAG: YggT family protein [Gemmatimonadaceae bacterium]
MEDKTIATDEARRVAGHEAIKARVESDVNADITLRSGQGSAAEEQKIDQVAGALRGGAIDEVASRDRDVSRGRGLARGSQLLDYVFYLIYGLLGIRLVLAMVAARSSNGFVQLIEAVTDPFYVIFRGIVPSPTVEGGYTLVVPIIIAIVVYALLHAAINGFLRMIVHRKTDI